MEVISYTTTSKDNIQNLGSYIIQRLRDEKLAYKMITSGSNHTLALRRDGTIFAWGKNDYGQLGLGHTIDQNTPQRIDPNHFQGKTIHSIHAGTFHTLALCPDGTLYAWGKNDYGQLGLGHNHNQNSPQRIDPDYIHGKTIQSIHTGGSHTLARCTDGTLFAWGRNMNGQLGLGHTHNQNTPQPINPDHFQGKTIQSISITSYNTLARCADDSLFVWGANRFEQLGLGHTYTQNTPQRINLNHFQDKTIQSIYTGDGNTFALCDNDSIYAWGGNYQGQLGLGHTYTQNTPQLINPDHFQGKTIQSIHTGYAHILARCTDDSLFAWGWNTRGQLGLGHTNQQNTPQLIEPNHFQGKTIQSISTGNHHALALLTDGTLFAWGWGQLGLGHNDNQLTPIQLPDLLEQAFRKGHQKLNSNTFFSNTSVDPTTRFLSGCVLHPNETAQSRAESTTTGMGK